MRTHGIVGNFAVGVAAVLAIAGSACAQGVPPLGPASPGTASEAPEQETPLAAPWLAGAPPCVLRPDQPCPPLMERPCGTEGAGSGGGGRELSACTCACGGGWWSRNADSVSLTPAEPQSSGTRSESFNFTSWTWSTRSEAQPGHAEAEVSVSGVSMFWHSASIAKSASARQETVEREEWVGLGPPCPRLVSLAAMGGGMLELTLGCSPEAGCAASGSTNIAGSCSSLGNASAQLVDKTVSGSVGYRSYEHSLVMDGSFGISVKDTGVGVDGKISSKVEWKLVGDGSVSGSAAYVVTPDRTYCAFTNRPLVLRSNGIAVATGGATVSGNGSASISGLALVSITAH